VDYAADFVRLPSSTHKICKTPFKKFLAAATIKKTFYPSFHSGQVLGFLRGRGRKVFGEF